MIDRLFVPLILLLMLTAIALGGCATGIAFGLNYGDAQGHTYGASIRLDPSFVHQKK